MFGRMIQKDGSLLCIIDGYSCVVSPSHMQYKKLYDAFNKNDDAEFKKWYEYNVTVEEFAKPLLADSNTLITVKNGKVYYKGELFVNTISEAIDRMYNAGLDIQPLVNFCKRLVKNPSHNSVKQLFKFLDIHKLYITEDGCFLAYKTVTSNYKDKHTGTIDNRPGAKIPRFERNEVEDNPAVHCGKGYHCGAFGYSGPGGEFNKCGDRVIIVKVAPEDVISVPTDYSCQKLRCCWYEIVSDYQGKLTHQVYSGKLNDDYSDKPRDNDIDISFNVDSIYDIDYSDKVSFTYNGESREGIVTGIEYDILLVKMTMTEKDKSANQFRQFVFDKMSNIKVI